VIALAFNRSAVEARNVGTITDGYALRTEARQFENNAPKAIYRHTRKRNGGIFRTMSDDILNRVKKVTVEELGVKEEEVSETSSFTDDLGADSLDVVELVMAFEDEFGIDIPDEEVGEIKTVGDAVTYITKKLG